MSSFDYGYSVYDSESAELPPRIISVPDEVDGRLRLAEDRDDGEHEAWVTGIPVEVQP